MYLSRHICFCLYWTVPFDAICRMNSNKKSIVTQSTYKLDLETVSDYIKFYCDYKL